MNKKRKKARIANLPNGVGVTPNSNGEKEYWKVRLGRKFTGGKVITRNFDTIAQAKEWIFGDAKTMAVAPGDMITLKQGAGASAFVLSARQLDEAANAFARCKDADISLTEAVSYAIKHYRPTGGKIAVKEAIPMLIAEKERKGKRGRYLEKLKAKLLRFSRYLGAKVTLNEVTRKTVEDYLDSLKQRPEGELIEARHLSVMFGWGVQKGFMAENPVKGMEKPKVERKPPTILKPGAVLNLLREAQELTPWVVAGLYGGMRPEEAQRLEWQDFDFSRRHIDLPAHKAKDRTRRIVPFMGHIEEWLLPYRKSSGAIVPPNFRRRFWQMAERAGYRLAEEVKGKSTAEGWPKDVLRHCFGSYHLAKWHSAGATAELMGHRDTKMLYNHYRDVIKDEGDVDLFWAIKPQGILDRK